jgi:hypothetical protein
LFVVLIFRGDLDGRFEDCFEEKRRCISEFLKDGLEGIFKNYLRQEGGAF